MLLTPDEAQKKTIQFCIRNKYAIMASEMGAGKTGCALGVWEEVGGRLLVVCPSYLIFNWIDEIRKWLGEKIIITAITEGKHLYDLIDTDICIVSYDIAARPQAECLYEWATMVVADECHALKEISAKRSEAFHKNIYENSIERLYLLSGTPIKNRVMEYYSLLALMNYRPGDKPPTDFLDKYENQFVFADKFSYRDSYQTPVWSKGEIKIVTVIKWSGLRNVKELKTYLKGFYIRGVAADLPRLNFKDILVSNTKDKELLADFNIFCGENTSVAPQSKVEAAVRTAPFTINYVQDLLNKVDSVLVYSDQVDSCEMMAQKFQVPSLTGKIPPKKRALLAKRFQNGEGQILCATIAALSSGVTLTRSANLVINDPPWVPGDLDQTLKRIHRKTQTRPCWIHKIHGSPQSKYIYNVLEEKGHVIKSVQKAMEE